MNIKSLLNPVAGIATEIVYALLIILAGALIALAITYL